jgi:hypothetical protein
MLFLAHQDCWVLQQQQFICLRERRGQEACIITLLRDAVGPQKILMIAKKAHHKKLTCPFQKARYCYLFDS